MTNLRIALFSIFGQRKEAGEVLGRAFSRVTQPIAFQSGNSDTRRVISPPRIRFNHVAKRRVSVT